MDTPGLGGPLIRSSRRWFVHLLSLALICAQFGMAVHASTHLDDRDVQAQACDYCITSHALQNMGGGDASFEFTVTVSHDFVAEVSSVPAPAAAPFRAFRSRAPPAVL